jgi:uncharacterized protein (UPF0261 family)
MLSIIASEAVPQRHRERHHYQEDKDQKLVALSDERQSQCIRPQATIISGLKLLA